MGTELAIAKRHPWYREDNETEKQYKAFSVYRDIGSDRTFLAAYNVHTGRKLVSRESVPPYFHKWYSELRWFDRATAYDSHINRLEMVERDRLATERASVWNNRREELRETKWELANLAFRQAREMLEYPTATTEVVEDGKVYKITPSRWSDKNVAANLAKTACELTSELTTIRVELPKVDEAPPDLAKLDEAQLQQLRSLLEKATGTDGS